MKNEAATSLGHTLVNKPTLIVHGNLQFLILDAPHYDNIKLYVDILLKNNVSDLVRTCEKTYEESYVCDTGIATHDLEFSDGEPPSEEIISKWMTIVNKASENKKAVAVHCLAGLGRAPVLVVIALIEYGMRSVDAIELVRAHRKGAINKRQLHSLINYRSRKRPAVSRWCCGLF